MAIFKTIQMKLTIKTDPETLFLLQKVILDSAQIIADTKGRKIGKSMRVELFDTVSKRCISYTSNPNGKDLSLTLKYHLANEVHDILQERKYYPAGIYESNKLDILKNKLHQQLL